MHDNAVTCIIPKACINQYQCSQESFQSHVAHEALLYRNGLRKVFLYIYHTHGAMRVQYIGTKPHALKAGSQFSFQISCSNQSLFRSIFVSLSLEGKLHQSRIEHQRHDEMECHHQGQRERRCEGRDLKVVRDQGTDGTHSSEDYHACHHDDAESKGELELLQDGWHFLEE